ncbi:MAG: hypothetical protein IJ859_00100 [Synergistaceae bacterium]|nr:hypothetical protein [Synergistaceae bacterium]
MSNYNENSVLQFGRLKEFGQAVAGEISKLKTASGSAIKYVSVANNTVSFFTSTDGSGTAAFSFNFPNELVLDQLKTTFVPHFAFSSETYAGATNPSLEGKPVLVIAVKDTNAAGTTTTNYSFLNMEDLIDIYTAGDNSINIDGYNISVKVSATTGNHLTLNNDGLMVDVSDKVDKVENATAGNIPVMTEAGGISDSGYTFATSADVTELNNELFPSA